MKKILLTVLTASGVIGSGFAQTTLYMNPATAGTNLTGTSIWATNLGGTYDQTWANGNNMYFDPTTNSQYGISASIVTGGTITIGNTTAGAQEVRLNDLSTNAVSFTNVTFLDTSASDSVRYNGRSLPGGSFSVNGRGNVTLGNNTPTSALNGTITVNAGAGISNSAQISPFTGYLSTNTAIVLNGQSSSSLATLTLDAAKVSTIGSLSGNTYTTINSGNSGGLTNTLIINQSSDTTYGGVFTFSTGRPGLIEKHGSGTLTFSGANAFNNQVTDFAVSGGRLIVGNTNNTTTTADYNAIAVNAGGTLASDATGRTLVGNSQTVSGGLITGGSNTNGFIATTAGATSIIDPTGIFALTQLQATNGLTLKIDSATDRLSLFTLAGATNAGGFSIDLTGFSGIADNTTYTVLSWVSGTGVELADFAGVLSGGKSMNSAFGSGGFQFFTDAGVTSLQLQVVPEPATWALLAGAGALLVLVRRRKRA